MGDIQVLLDKLGGQQVGGVITVYEDGVNKEAAKCIDGNWIINEDWLDRVAAAKATKDSGRATLTVPKKGD